MYKHCKVNIDSSHFLIFDAICKDCNNSLWGWSDTVPQKGCSLEIIILTCNTRGQELKHNIMRHLKGLKIKLFSTFIYHLYYLNEECAAFVSFDESIDVNTKLMMAKNININGPYLDKIFVYL